MPKLNRTMPTRAPDDPRTRGHETTYQASRGGWVKSTKPEPKTPRRR